MGYREPEYYFEKYLKSNKPFEKRCLRCGKQLSYGDYKGDCYGLCEDGCDE